MKLAIFSADDSIFLFNAWCDFVDLCKGKHKIAGIFVFPDILKNKRGAAIYLEYLKILGLRDFIKLTFKTLRRRLMDKNKKYSNFKDLIAKNNITIFYKDNPNQDEIIEWIKGNEIDIVFITFGYIVKKPFIEAPKIGVFNKHSALLPSFRGLWPVFWTMFYNSDIGVSVHKVAAEIDGGEIILQKKYIKNDNFSVFDWYNIIYKDMADLFLRALENLESGNCDAAYAAGPASYYSLPTRKEYLEFKDNGLKFV